MRVLLTGASSFTGFWFVARLASRGVEVIAPLRGAPDNYSGVRKDRIRLLVKQADIIPDCAFGSDAFLDLVRTRDVDVLCHHAAEVGDYRNPDFDVPGALAANTRNLRETLSLMRDRGLKAVLATGSVFEADEGSGPSPRRAFSPYGLSKTLTWATLKYWGEALNIPASKFVIANPFGPFEEPRFVAHCVSQWAKDEIVTVRTPKYLRDNIHVDLLSSAYAQFVEEAAAGATGRVFGPCGYLETQAAFAERLSRELAPRLGVEGRVAFGDQADFSEPLARVNRDVIDSAAYGWNEEQAWDALAGYYRQRGLAGGPRARTEILGAVDVFGRDGLRGWLAAKPAGAARHVSILIDGVEKASVRADLWRQDLRDLQISDGYSGFAYEFGAPNPYADVTVRLEDRETGHALPGGEALVLPRLAGAVDSPFVRHADDVVANITDVTYEPGKIDLLLTCIGPRGRLPAPRSGDADLEVVETRPLQQAYFDPFDVEAAHLRLALRRFDPNAPISVRFGGDAGQPFSEIVLPAQLPGFFTELGVENIERVAGPRETLSHFASTGYAAAFQLDALVRRHFGHGIADCSTCLDWGAGPGRVAAPLKRVVAPGLRLTAVDVDLVNLEFGRASFPDIAFVEAPFLPPLPFPPASFGAIFGVSVVTHLAESVQFAWLEELRRLATPGAPVILTIHSELSLFRLAEHSPQICTQTLKDGFSDRSLDGTLGKRLRQRNYYRATFHTHKYVRENWSEYFDVLRIYPNANHLLQDFVVLRAR